eukprot:4034845-Lingulodinium_polyedra.AAC.1
MARGRWSTLSSVRRYAKPGAVQRLWNSMAEEARGFCVQAADRLEAVVAGHASAALPPSMGGPR